MQNASKESIKNDVPHPETNLLKIPPYKGFSVNENNYYEILHLEFYSNTIDCYCQKCDKESTFQRINISLPLKILPDGHRLEIDIADRIEKDSEIPDILSFANIMVDKNQYNNLPVKSYALAERFFIVEFRCTRCKDQKLLFFYIITNSKLIKIGQYPSIADLERNAVKRYSKLLGKEKTVEFNDAIRLYSNGIGIASFVYLRRVFEFLLERAHLEASNSSDWNEELYVASRVDEKIQLLVDFLPNFLVETRKIYSVLSKGIHELTEDECLMIFNPLKLIIEIILDHKIEQEERIRKEKEVKNQLSEIIEKIKK